jgi:hypothetical protein
MAGDRGAPVQYLNLACVDPTVPNPGANFSGILDDPGFNGGAVRGRFWIYDKLRVHVNSDHLIVVPGQPSFVRVDGD